MPVAVVDRFEALEVEHAHRQRDVFLPRERQRLIQQIREKRSIGKPGQHVMHHPPLQGMQQLAFFTDVETNRQVTVNPPGGVIHKATRKDLGKLIAAAVDQTMSKPEWQK
ncbi:hypothetical protein [Pseudomonas sp. O230]|uniref:hypothetical protein n=1 Tax=Pseudomonas sp. O230 TaxID=3159450 RepID=UPI00387AA5BC